MMEVKFAHGRPSDEPTNLRTEDFLRIPSSRQEATGIADCELRIAELGTGPNCELRIADYAKSLKLGRGREPWRRALPKSPIRIPPFRNPQFPISLRKRDSISRGGPCVVAERSGSQIGLPAIRQSLLALPESRRSQKAQETSGTKDPSQRKTRAVKRR